MQAELNPNLITENTPEFLKEMAKHKVPFSGSLMSKALGFEETNNVKVSRVVPGDIIVIEGKRHKVKRINDKGEWITEILQDVPTK